MDTVKSDKALDADLRGLNQGAFSFLACTQKIKSYYSLCCSTKVNQERQSKSRKW